MKSYFHTHGNVKIRLKKCGKKRISQSAVNAAGWVLGLIMVKALGDKKFTDRIEITERKILKQIDSIEKLQAKIDAKFKLSGIDSSVLNRVRSNDPTGNTTSDKNTYRFDHRYSGSANQRKITI